MIEVIVRLVPFGDHSREREIGHIEIANVDADHRSWPAYSYQAWVNDFGVRREGSGEVKHNRSLNVFYLVGVAIEDFVRKLMLSDV